LNKTIKILIWVLAGIILVAIIVFVSTKRKNEVCTKVSIQIIDSAAIKIIDTILILGEIEEGGNKIINRPIEEVNISEIEQRISNNLFVKHAEVYLKINGELVVQVEPRIPVVRICNKLSQHFQIDNEGFVMPVSKKNLVRILVANGNISHKPKYDTVFNIYENKYDKRIDIKTLREIHELALYIKTSTFWTDQVQQIFINDEDEIELSTLVGNQVVSFGNIDNYKEKFRNLEAFYKKAMPIKGWNAYNEINVKYKNQVVCTRVEQLNL
jgi:cell division protein FtsQ